MGMITPFSVAGDVHPSTLPNTGAAGSAGLSFWVLIVGAALVVGGVIVWRTTRKSS